MTNLHCHWVNEVLGFGDVLFYPWLRGDCCHLPGKTGATFRAISHYRLLERLCHKAPMVPNKLAIIINEARHLPRAVHTSAVQQPDARPLQPGSTRQCPCCGTVNAAIGGKKFACCNWSQLGCRRDVGRDDGGAEGNAWCGIGLLHGDDEYVPQRTLQVTRLTIRLRHPQAAHGARPPPAPLVNDVSALVSVKSSKNNARRL